MLLDFLRISVFSLVLIVGCQIMGGAILVRSGLGNHRDPDTDNVFLSLFFSVSLGLAVTITLLFGLGLVRGLRAPVVVLLWSTLVLLALFGTRRRLGQVFPGRDLSRPTDIAGHGVLILLFVVTTLVSLRAPGHWDDTMYHLPLARTYVEHRAIVLNPYVRFPLFPQNIHLLMTAGLMLDGVKLAQAFATLPLWLLSLGLLGAGRWFTQSILPGLVSVFLVWTAKPVIQTIGFAYIDNGLALFCLGAILAVARWRALASMPGAMRWLAVSGVLAGMAAGTKIFGAALAGLIGLYLLLIARQARGTALFMMFCLIAGSAWYARSFWISGDPVHPAGGNLFGHFLWNEADLLSQKKEQSGHGVGAESLNLPGALSEAGVVLWTLALVSWVLRAVPPSVRSVQLIFTGYLLFWFFVTQVDRYLAPVYGAAALLSAYLVHRTFRATQLFGPLATGATKLRVFTAQFIALVLFLPLLAMAWKMSSYDIEHRAQVLDQMPGHAVFSHANALDPRHGRRMLQLGFENANYLYNGTAIGDWFGVARYSSMLECPGGKCRLAPPAVILQSMEKHDARILAVSLQQFPAFDKAAYEGHFDMAFQDRFGVLMVRK